MRKQHHFGEQRAGLLCYIVGMVVLLTIYQVLLAVVSQLNLFGSIARYKQLVQGLSVSLLFLMLGLLWLAYRQWRTVIHEHDQLETILESIGPDVIVAIDKNNTILRCGGAVEQMSGYTPEELVGKKADLLYYERRDKGQSYEIQSAIQHAGFHLGYATGRTKQEEDYLLEIQTSGLQSQNGGAVLILHNLDERQQSQSQLQRRVKIEETFAEISTGFLSTRPDQFGEACINALEKTADIFAYESACVGFLNESGRALREIWSWPADLSFKEDFVLAAESVPEDTPTAYRFPENSKSAPAPVAALHIKEDIRSIVLSPMILQGYRFGFLCMYSKEKTQRWKPEDNTILLALASTFLTGELSIRAAELLLPSPSKTNADESEEP